MSTASPTVMITPTFLETCAQEALDPQCAAVGVANGSLVYLCSKKSETQEGFSPRLVGEPTRRKAAALLGLGPRDKNREAIVQSISVILAARPDVVMDLTTNPEGIALRSELKQVVGVPLGACLTYDLFSRPREKFTESVFLERLEASLASGIDFALLHWGMSWPLIDAMKNAKRVMPTTSRGGGLICRYMRLHHCENPFVEYLDGIACLFHDYGVVVDLGDIFRPGCTADAGDEMKWMEIEFLATQREALRTHGVQVLCEGGGHIPLNKITELLPKYKARLGNAPMWLSGPVVADTGVTLDSIVNTIGVAFAGLCGGDMFCSITQNEHYAMPTAVETAEALRNIHVAIEAVELARGRTEVVDRNNALSRARARNAWSSQVEYALYPDLANQAFIANNLLKDGVPCTICGSLCPHIIVRVTPDTSQGLQSAHS